VRAVPPHSLSPEKKVVGWSGGEGRTLMFPLFEGRGCYNICPRSRRTADSRS
jgi:hypothetical protein